ncbi:MAG: hypothetical protein CME61_01525 [Halobacteriovoraceae bacterium]|nr:hypothetical protein [Halobacteriovoraceae bacterium]
MTNDRNILILKNRAIGDSLISLSSLQYFKELNPRAKVYFGVPRWIVPLYRNSDIAADEIIPLEFSSLQNVMDLYSLLLNKKIFRVIELFPKGRSQKFFSMFSRLTGAEYFFRDYHSLELNERQEPIIQKDLNTISAYLQKEAPNFLDYPPKFNVKKNHRSKSEIIFGVVASRETKMWPLGNFIKLAYKIKSKFNAQIIVPVSSSSQDLEIKKELISLDRDNLISIVHLPLESLPQRFSNALCYIGNDTGLKHLSVSLGIKTFTFFGPEPPREWHPYDRNEHPFFYKDPLGCRTEKSYFCDLSECKSMVCLKDISVEEVYSKVGDYLQNHLG